MVRRHIHHIAVGRIGGSLTGHEAVDVGGILCRKIRFPAAEGVSASACGYMAEKVFHRPVVHHIEGVFGKLRLGGFGEHEHGAPGSCVKGGAGLVPEIDRHHSGYVAPESVDARFGKPECHGVEHGGASGALTVVELVYVGPIVWAVHLSVFVEFVVLGVLRHPGVVAAGMVGYPVDNHLYARGVGRVDKSLEVLHRAEFGVYLFVVGHGVVASELALAVDFRDGVYGHKPQYVGPELFKAREVPAERAECSFRGVLAHVYFVDNGVAAPFGVRQRGVGRSRAPAYESGERACECGKKTLHLFFVGFADRYHASYRLVERYEGFCAGNARYHLYLLVEKLHQVLVVAGVQLDQHRVGAGGEVAFHDFGYLLELGHYFAVHGAALEVHTYVCAGGISEYLGVDIVARACDYLEVYHALQALVYGRA